MTILRPLYILAFLYMCELKRINFRLNESHALAASMMPIHPGSHRDLVRHCVHWPRVIHDRLDGWHDSRAEVDSVPNDTCKGVWACRYAQRCIGVWICMYR